ncbi:hypothetical protein PT285_03195 [Lactobacillus sp. ESL0791]|uniref:hypothetical protein n=1 Tax=Lactobacillus sp. ESL0791 TaxID=2983234 RepID=UPI0023F8A332|nr:hypothetical protein [Lactobacillus sp. ESL0791]MDF7638441.1 hypothetical protein [Lactobacillus sp. ESL0791]
MVNPIKLPVKVSHTIPKKFWGKWYQLDYGKTYSIQKYTKTTEAFYSTGTKPYPHEVTVKKYNSNKYLIYPGTKTPTYKQYLSLTHLTYKGKTYRALIFNNKKDKIKAYYFNHKLPVHYSEKLHEFYK